MPCLLSTRAGSSSHAMMLRRTGRDGAGAPDELASGQLEFAVRQLVLRSLHRDAGDVLCAALWHWRDVCQYTRSLWRRRIAAVSRRVHRLARRTMSVLQAFLAHRRHKKETAISALLKAAERVQRGGLRGWVQWCSRRMAKVIAMQLALQHRASALIKKTQREWLAAAASGALQRQRMQGRLQKASRTQTRRTCLQVCWAAGHARCGGEISFAANGLVALLLIAAPPRKVLQAWSSEIVGQARVLAAFRELVLLRQNRRLYNQVGLCVRCGASTCMTPS